MSETLCHPLSGADLGQAGPEMGGALGLCRPSSCQDRAGPGGAGPEVGETRGGRGVGPPAASPLSRVHSWLSGRGLSSSRAESSVSLGAGVGAGGSWDRGHGGPR